MRMICGDLREQMNQYTSIKSVHSWEGKVWE
jgi:hypothetical protein